MVQSSPSVNVHGIQLFHLAMDVGTIESYSESGGNFLKDHDCLIFKQTVHCLNYGIFLPNGEAEQKQVYNLALVFHMAECDK